MGNLLATQKSHKKNSRSTITDHDRAVLALKAQRKKMEDQTRLLEKRIEDHTIVARTLIVQKKKDRALLALKKKKLSENQLQSIQAYLLNVEDMLSNMELTKQQSNVMAALKQGNEALKKAQQEMPLDDIQSLMDETAEAKEYQDKVQNMLSQQLDASDNEAVLQELQQLEDAALQEELQQMPSVPATEPQQQQQQAQQQPEQPSQQQEQQSQEEGGKSKAAAESVQLEEELPSVPKTKVPEASQQAEERQPEEPLAAS